MYLVSGNILDSILLVNPLYIKWLMAGEHKDEGREDQDILVLWQHLFIRVEHLLHFSVVLVEGHLMSYLILVEDQVALEQRGKGLVVQLLVVRGG